MNRYLSSRFPEPSFNSTFNCNTPSPLSRLSPNEHIQRVIDILQQGQLSSLLTVLIKVLDPSEKDFAAIGCALLQRISPMESLEARCWTGFSRLIPAHKLTQIAQRPHILCYDNINISTSILVEQRSSALAKVQSGAFLILYGLKNVD